MIYPKIPRKSLALLLICLIFTLAAVGIMFIIYFFNANNSLFVRPVLKKVYSEGEFHHHHQQQHLQQQQQQHLHQQHEKQLDEAQQHPSEHLPRYEKQTEGAFYEPYDGVETHRKQLKYALKEKKHLRNTHQHQHQQHEAAGSDEFSDTIYIDDYDRFNDKIDSDKNRNSAGGSPAGEDGLLDINGIDYFETIILDHNSIKNSGQMRGTEKTLPHPLLRDGAEALSSKERDLLTFTKGLNQRRNRLNRIKGKRFRGGNSPGNKLKSTITTTTTNTGDDEAFDNETIGSGSGDFIDDTEIDDDKQAQQQQIKQMQLQRHGERARKHFKASRRSGARKQEQQKNKMAPQFEIEKNNENLYSVSSEIISNLSNESTYKPASSTSTLIFGGGFVTSTTTSLSNAMTSSQTSQTSQTSSTEARTNRINQLDKKPPLSMLLSPSSSSSSLTATGSVSNKKWMPPSVVSSREVVTSLGNQSTPPRAAAAAAAAAIEEQHQNGAWLETRARRIMGNVKKSEERSRQLLLCEEAGGGELCRMLFKGHLNE